MNITLHDTGRYELKQYALDQFVIWDNDYIKVVKRYKTLKSALNLIHKLEV